MSDFEMSQSILDYDIPTKICMLTFSFIVHLDDICHFCRLSQFFVVVRVTENVADSIKERQINSDKFKLPWAFSQALAAL